MIPALKAAARQWHKAADALPAWERSAMALRIAAYQLKEELADPEFDNDSVPDLVAFAISQSNLLVDLARRDPAAAAALITQAASWLLDDPDRFLTIPRPPPDATLLDDPAVRAMFLGAVRESVRTGLDGYVTDEVLERRPWGFRLEDVDVDVSLWHGEQDVYIPRSHVEAAAALLPRSRTSFHPSEGHGLILSQWAAILDDVRA